MRTTVDLDEELLRTAKAIAEVRGKTLSVVISELAWRGLAADQREIAMKDGVPVMPVRAGARPVTPEHVAQLLDRADLEELGDEAVR